MQRLLPQFGCIAPGEATVSRLETPARFLVPMRGYVQDLCVPRVDNDVVNEQSRSIQIHQHAPGPRPVSRYIDLSVKGSKIEAIRIARIYNKVPYVAARRSC